MNKTNVKVGVVVTAGVILFLLIFGWARNISYLSEERIISMSFPTVSGLEVGDQVSVNGVRSGYVKDIIMTGNGVQVTASIDKNVVLHPDTRANIAMLDLMGGKKIEINPGTAAGTLDEQQPVPGTYDPAIPEVMAMAGSLASDLPELLTKIDSTLNGINAYLHDDQLRDDIGASVAAMREITGQMQRILKKNAEGIDRIVENTGELTEKSIALIDSNKAGISESLARAQELLASSEKLVSAATEIIEETRAGENNLGKVLNDEELMTSLTESIENLRTISAMLLEQMKNEGIQVDAKISF